METILLQAIESEITSFCRVEVRLQDDDDIVFYPLKNDIWTDGEVNYTISELCELLDDFIRIILMDISHTDCVVGVKE